MSDEYIRKADAIRWVKTECNPYGKPTLDFESGKKVIEHLERMSSADVVQMRHGKWTHKPDVHGVVYCSECDYELHTNSTSYCPNCGAKMDKE